MNTQMDNYDALMEKIDFSPNGNKDENFSIYKKMEECSTTLIDEFKTILTNDLRDKNGTLSCGAPSFLDDYAAPMENLARLYIEHKEYKKALVLLERVLPIYRTLEIRNPNYTFQRYYATQLLIECLRNVGNEELATLYDYEITYLFNDFIKPRAVSDK